MPSTGAQTTDLLAAHGHGHHGGKGGGLSLIPEGLEDEDEDDELVLARGASATSPLGGARNTQRKPRRKSVIDKMDRNFEGELE